jgi:hypothetical protein
LENSFSRHILKNFLINVSMKKIISFLLLLSPLIGFTQDTASQVKYLIKQPWRVSEVMYKLNEADKYDPVQEDKLDSCLKNLRYYFYYNGDARIEGEGPCKEVNIDAGWKFIDNFNRLDYILDEDQIIHFDVNIVGSSQLELDVKSENDGKPMWIRTIYEPVTKGALMTDLLKISKMNAAEHRFQIEKMGYKELESESPGLIYRFKRADGGQLTMYKNIISRFPKIVFKPGSKLSRNYFWEFLNTNNFFIVMQGELQYQHDGPWYQLRKGYKDGYIFEADEYKQTFTAYTPPTEQDIKDLVKAYPATDFPELNIKGKKN